MPTTAVFFCLVAARFSDAVSVSGGDRSDQITRPSAVPLTPTQDIARNSLVRRADSSVTLSSRGTLSSAGQAGLLEELAQGTHLEALEFQDQDAKFRLHRETPVGQSNLKIPRHVILTGPFGTFAEVRRHRGDLAALGITPDMQVRYFNDTACRKYLLRTAPELATFFSQEQGGSFRGDICRTAVLAKEGGFYVDLDMQLVAPLEQLVDDQTTFMTARSDAGNLGCLNALIAVTPENPVMRRALDAILQWYRNEIPRKGLLGPTTLQIGLEESMSSYCPNRHWADAFVQFQCGQDAWYRLFQEQFMGYETCVNWGPRLCPKRRGYARFVGLRYGLFDGAKDGMADIKHPTLEDIENREKRFIGWSRYEYCDTEGCGLSGGEPE